MQTHSLAIILLISRFLGIYSLISIRYLNPDTLLESNLRIDFTETGHYLQET